MFRFSVCKPFWCQLKTIAKIWRSMNSLLGIELRGVKYGVFKQLGNLGAVDFDVSLCFRCKPPLLRYGFSRVQLVGVFLAKTNCMSLSIAKNEAR